MQITGIDALRRAVEILRTQTAAALVCNVTPQAVSEIIRKGKRVPAEWCLPLERATELAGEKISAHQLRPDLYPAETPADARKRRPANQTGVAA
jgi:DNA-binding transcriptional regulator YdaS (Cro superfamily)